MQLTLTAEWRKLANILPYEEPSEILTIAGYKAIVSFRGDDWEADVYKGDDVEVGRKLTKTRDEAKNLAEDIIRRDAHRTV